MSSILDHFAGSPERTFAAGSVLVSEGKTTGRLYVLIDGSIEVARGATQVAAITEPGSVFGEMAILLGTPHTATVRTLSEARLYEIEDGDQFLRAHPDVAYMLARLLAHRLNAATTYLVDIKRQFEGQGNHLAMVGEVLESLIHQPRRDVTPGSDRRGVDPRL